MSERLTFDVRDGRAIVRKAALGRAEQLAREAEALRRGAGPHVVRLLEIEGTADAPAALVLEAVTGADLSDQSLRVTEVARVMASVTEAISRLHEAGVAHGNLGPEHVLLDGDDVVLCGFGASVTRAAGDEAEGSWDAATAADVARLGQMVDVLTTSAGGDDPLLRHALRRISERATRPHPAERPNADVLAAALRSLVSSDGPMPLRPPTDTAGDRRRGGGRLLLGAGAAVAVLAAALAGVPALAGDGPSPDSRFTTSTPTSTTPPTTTTTTTAPPAPVRIWPRQCDGACEVPAITFEGVRYLAGGPGDLAVVADAGCDGHPQAVVVRPATGAVYVLASWPGAGEEVRATAHTLVPPPITHVAVTSPPGTCGHLVLSGPEGDTTLPLVDLTA